MNSALQLAGPGSPCDEQTLSANHYMRTLTEVKSERPEEDAIVALDRLSFFRTITEVRNERPDEEAGIHSFDATSGTVRPLLFRFAVKLDGTLPAIYYDPVRSLSVDSNNRPVAVPFGSQRYGTETAVRSEDEQDDEVRSHRFP
jgi:hypothetical protein